MKTRNNYGSIPRGPGGQPLAEWWCVEEEPGIAVSGDDYHFDTDDYATAERMAVNLAAQTDSTLTVVRYNRIEGPSFKRTSRVERLD